MSSAVSPREALSRIPGWDRKSVACTELKGGLTNRTYLVESQARKAVLRLDAEHTSAFHLNRPRELSVLKTAADRGFAPEVIYSDVNAGILLSAFIPGRAWDASDLEDRANLEALMSLLHEVHALPACGSSYDTNRIARRYVKNLSSHRDLHSFGVRCQQIVERIDGSGVRCCCHNDVVAENLVSASRLMLLDWEYACDNDPLFDLATLISYHDLSDKKTQELLSAYSGGSDPAMAEMLDEQVRLYDAIQWLWFANRHVITPTPAQAAALQKLKQRIR